MCVELKIVDLLNYKCSVYSREHRESVVHVPSQTCKEHKGEAEQETTEEQCVTKLRCTAYR